MGSGALMREEEESGTRGNRVYLSVSACLFAKDACLNISRIECVRVKC